MSKFETFRDRLIAHYQEHLKDKPLFVVDDPAEDLWNLYLDSFPEGTNPMYRQRREYDCSCCRHFMKEMAPVVWVDENYHIHSIFEFYAESEIYQPVMDALANEVKKWRIVGPYLHNDKFGTTVGTVSSLEHTDNGGVQRWKHFYLPLESRHVFHTTSTRTIGSELGKIVSQRDVFKRSLDEITEDATDTLLELIASNSLYRGTEWKETLENFRELQEEYSWISDADQKENFCWVHSYDLWLRSNYAAVGITNLRNHSIGKLLTDISEGRDLEEAVKSYEQIVAPANYKRPKAIFTQKMLDAAQKTVEDLGLANSLPRRFAVLDDIPVASVAFVNKDAGKSDVTQSLENVWDAMSKDTKASSTMIQKMIDNARQVPVESFIKDILPLAEEVEVFVQGKHEKNLMSLIAPVNKDTPSLFKWDNGFSWVYNGNLASSDIRANVKDAGGAVEGALRFSIQWNENGDNDDDLDAHCAVDCGAHREHIFYAHKSDAVTLGELDIDITQPNIQRPGKPAVENIVFPNKEQLLPGTYSFFVNCYAHRGGRDGFRAEIEFDGNVFRYSFPESMYWGQNVRVADVIVAANGHIEVKQHYLTPDAGTKKIWEISTDHFAPVTVIAESPNYWGENHVGARHLFFMLKGCMNPDTPNGFFNEYLRDDLRDHRRVFEALGSRMAPRKTGLQLSGLGFNLTERNELIVKVKGQANQVLKVIF